MFLKPPFVAPSESLATRASLTTTTAFTINLDGLCYYIPLPSIVTIAVCRCFQAEVFTPITVITIPEISVDSSYIAAFTGIFTSIEDVYQEGFTIYIHIHSTSKAGPDA